MPVLSWRRLAPRLLILLLPLIPEVASAQRDDGFTVRNIVEDVRDENLAQGRNRALILAQREAYQILMQRLTAQSDWPRLPKVDDAALEDLVQDVGIDQERVAPARVIATLSVHFKPDAIRRILRNAGIAYAEWRGRPLAILPLWQTEPGPVYAEAANPWRDLWRSGSVAGLVPTVVPAASDLPEGATATALAIPSDELMAALAQKLNNADVLVVSAAAAKNESGQFRLDLAMTGEGPLAGRLSGQKGYGGDQGESLDQILQRAAVDLTRAIDDGWKAANLLQYDKQGSLVAVAPLASFADWLAIRDKLARATAVRSYDVAALSRNEAALVLHYVGEQGQLESVLMQNGLVLTWDEEHWALRNTGSRACCH
jgi:hypothetical protein